MFLTINGEELQNYAWNIRTLGGRWSVPAVSQKNIVPAARHGSIWVPNKTFEENTLTLSMWAVGSESDGDMPFGSMAQKCRDNLDALTRIFGIRHGLLTVLQTDDDGNERQCFGEVVQAIDFSTHAGGSKAEFSVEVLVPAAFWQDTADQVFTSSTGLTPTQTLSLPEFGDSTAPMDDLIYTVSGPATNAKLTDVNTGRWVQLNDTIANGSTWTLNAKLFTSAVGATNKIGVTAHSQPGALMSLWAPITGTPSLRLDGSTFGGNTQVTVTGRRKYLIA